MLAENCKSIKHKRIFMKAFTERNLDFEKTLEKLAKVACFGKVMKIHH